MSRFNIITLLFPGSILPAVYTVLLPAAGTLSMSIKENYAVNHRLVTDLPLVISGWLKVDRRSGTRINALLIA